VQKLDLLGIAFVSRQQSGSRLQMGGRRKSQPAGIAASFRAEQRLGISEKPPGTDWA
jgi:hypothetical protein